MEYVFGRCSNVATLGKKPRLEFGRTQGVEAVQELLAESGQPDSVLPMTGCDQPNVYNNVRRKTHHDGISAQLNVPSEQTAELRQTPSQGSKRIVGLTKQQRTEPAARRRPLREDQIAKQRPRFATSWPIRLGSELVDAWLSNQVDFHFRISTSPTS
jgi:hypothetical protein